MITAIVITLLGAYVLCVMLSKRRIHENGKPYIDRWYLTPSTRWGRPFLHHIIKRDDNPNLHNHPWPAFSIVLWGGYYETRWDRKPGEIAPVYFRRVGAGSISRLGARTFHRIHKVDRGGAWTLFFHGKRNREWGFLVRGRFVHHDHKEGRGE